MKLRARMQLRVQAEMWDLKTIRAVLMVLHTSFGVLCLVFRPYLFEIRPGYAGLAQLLTTREWGALALVIAFCLYACRKPGLAQVFSQLASGALLSVIVVAVSWTIGPNLSTVAYGVFGGMSLWSFYRVIGLWFDILPGYRRLQTRVQRRGRHRG